MHEANIDVLRQLHRIARESELAARVHAYAANRWNVYVIAIAVPASTLSVLAGVAALSRLQDAKSIAALLAIVAGGLTALLATLAPRERTNSHQRFAAKFEALRNDALVAKATAIAGGDQESAQDLLQRLNDRQNALVAEEPTRPASAKRRALRGGFRGETAADVYTFGDVTELYGYLAQRVRTVRRTIDDITWGSRKGYRSIEERQAYGTYVASVQSVARKENVTYREVSSFADRQYLDRSKQLFDVYGYQLRYVSVLDCTVPLLSFIVLDREEIVFGFYRGRGRSDVGEIYLSVRETAMVTLFTDYFDTIWGQAVKVKDEQGLDNERVQVIEATLL